MRKYGNYELSIIFVKKRDWASVTRSDSKLKALKGAFNYFLVGKADCVCMWCGVVYYSLQSTQPESFEYKTTRQTMNSPGAKMDRNT